MRLNDVWLVVAETGEYSDRSEQHVAAYSTEQEANDHVERLSEAARRQGSWWGERDGRGNRPIYGGGPFEFEGFRMGVDYTGIRFRPARVP